ncbi:hydantoinase/oxoprolinase family protein [Halapricum hydrolyticum]|uniref:Hydantoinase/oxoprolinase family protein n=1 Tax=Halapricum hydrolyticum TaxID=2979991 RepID=A0AAE3IDD5_9EURY|nr:hydantoinase/oxoprolinase family protein [Halapricum hydrolyticum]MCU4718916.1 hydantoinase/oxoprolinase family protein [Halapricum hydrolyticum]MCU4727991.1 hydantoinase/oxoprolinase family protein [Halapricum hydrolyticum]
MTRIGVDIGGTFTDVVIVDDEGRLRGVKTPSTPEQPDDGVVDGLEQARDDGIDVADTEFLGHGTTVATNAVLEDDLPPTALVTTDGFRDVLEIGRQDRPDLYDLDFERPPPLVPRDHRLTVSERIGPDGNVVEPLRESEVAELADRLPDVDAVAVSTLFAFRNPVHERAIREGLREHGDDVAIALSSAVLPEFREYERTSTTALNAALKPRLDAYLGRLSDRTRATGIDEQWAVMQSHGGLMSVRTAREKPVNTVLSGPAAGVQGAQYLADEAGYEDIITMDMGGTSTDVSLVDGGEPSLSTDWEIAGHPLGVPTIDIHTIGAGGGSIAWIDAGGALRVGPRSAGADPGPAAYGRGGTQPTVTDAHVVLGRIHPEYPLGGDLSVDVDAAREAIERGIADELGQSVRDAAQGILEVARANMERALRVVSVEQGYDPRSFALVAFGGAGPLHAPRLGEELSIPTVLVPRLAGVLSGLGLLASDLEHAYVTSVVEPLTDVTADELRDWFAKLAAEGTETLAADGIDEASMRFERSLDLRYAGQSYSLNVPIEGDPSEETLAAATDRFHAEHEAHYGHANPDERVELVNVRLRAIGEIPSIDVRTSVEGTVRDAVLGERPVQFGDEKREVTVYEHGHLPSGGEFDGPAVVQAAESTTVVHPGQSVSVDDRGTLVITTGKT